MSLALFLLVLPGASAGGALHSPHDAVHSTASAALPGGKIVTVAVGTEDTVMFTLDGGLHWQLLAGAGLELQVPWEVAYHPGLAAAGGSGRFVIGTEHGVWTWDPVADVVAEFSAGLIAGDRHILDLEAPLAGSDGPVVALTALGRVYLLQPAAGAWQPVLDTGVVFARRGDVALTPHYDSQSSAPRSHDLWVASSGRLWVSRDGGVQWTRHAAFAAPAARLTDWMITTIALAENYDQTGAMMIGRGKQDALVGLDVGEILRSLDGGASFSACLQLPTAVMSIAATPPGLGGVRTWLAAGRAFPNYGAYQGVGILLSNDDGSTWGDFGNHQDFLIEDNPGRRSGNIALNYEQELSVLPDWAQRGEVLFARQEGLWISQDGGLHWLQRQMRTEREFRDLATAWTASDQRAVFGAGYGSGTMMHLPDQGVAEALREEPQMLFTRRLDISPNYSDDGNVLVVGNTSMWAWQSDAVPPANPQGATWWWRPENRDPVSGQTLTGYPNVVEYSPRFDARGLTGSDLTYFWSSYELGPFRSEDNGVTAKALHTTSTGGFAPEMSCFAIAPTYDAGGARTDAYAGAASGQIFRLDNEKWRELAALGPAVMDLVISPLWSRPAQPLLYAALDGAPYVVEVRDEPTGVVVTPLALGLPAVAANGIALHPDFGALPIVYLSTFASGIWRLDLSAPQPQWETIGTGFPRLWVRKIALSPAFQSDALLYVATQDGIWECEDAPGSVWRRITLAGTRDDVDETFQYYQPADPANPSPTHGWPWGLFKAWNMPAGLVPFGEGVRFTVHDLSWTTTNATCKSLEALCFTGPTLGSLRVEVFDYTTGAPVGALTEDLAAGALKPHRIRLDLGARRDVRIVLTALLDPGELMLFDAIEFRD